MGSDGLGGCYGIDQIESELIDRMVLVRNIEKLTKELETTKKQLEESLRVIEFYSIRDNWNLQYRGDNFDTINATDLDINTGGRKAREFLNKLKNERGK